MATITAQTSSSLTPSNQMLYLLDAMYQDSKEQGKVHSEKKERCYDKQIELQQKNIQDTEKKIKSTFKAALLNAIVSTAVSIGSTIAGELKLGEVMDKLLQEGKKAKAIAMKVGIKLVENLPGYVAIVNPFTKKEGELTLAIEQTNKQITEQGKKLDQAQDAYQQAKASHEKVYSTMNAYVQSEVAADSALATF